MESVVKSFARIVEIHFASYNREPRRLVAEATTPQSSPGGAALMIQMSKDW
jgi:hypothetical protein